MQKQLKAFSKDCQLKMLAKKEREDNNKVQKVVLDTRDEAQELKSSMQKLAEDHKMMRQMMKADQQEIMQQIQQLQMMMLAGQANTNTSGPNSNSNHTHDAVNLVEAAAAVNSKDC